MATDEKQLSRLPFEEIDVTKSGLSKHELFIEPVIKAKNELMQYFIFLKLRDYSDLTVEPVYSKEQINLLIKYEELLDVLNKHFKVTI